MDILIVNKYDWDHPDAGGAEHHLRTMVSSLADEHDVRLLCARGPDDPQKQEKEGAQVHHIGPPSESFIPVMVLGHLIATIHAWRWDADIIISDNSPLPWFIPSTSHRIDVFHHLYHGFWFERMGHIMGTLGYIWEKIGLIMARWHDTTVAVSESTADELATYGINTDSIIPPSVDVGSFWNNEEKNTVLFIGRHVENKGIEDLELIMGSLDKECHIAGSGPLDDISEDLAETYDHITYHGYVSDEKKRQLLADSSVVVMPSAKEGWGIVATEAQAASSAVVGYDVQGLRDSVITGELVQEGDVEAMRKSITRSHAPVDMHEYDETVAYERWNEMVQHV